MGAKSGYSSDEVKNAADHKIGPTLSSMGGQLLASEQRVKNGFDG
jgi:hypothetical protein